MESNMYIFLKEANAGQQTLLMPEDEEEAKARCSKSWQAAWMLLLLEISSRDIPSKNALDAG